MITKKLIKSLPVMEDKDVQYFDYIYIYNTTCRNGLTWKNDWIGIRIIWKICWWDLVFIKWINYPTNSLSLYTYNAENFIDYTNTMISIEWNCRKIHCVQVLVLEKWKKIRNLVSPENY